MSSTDEDRWLEAGRRITPQLSPARRRASRRAWLLLILAGLGYGALTTVIRLFLPHNSTAASNNESVLPATFWFGLATASIGFLAFLAGLIRGLATKRLRPTWERVDGALSRSQNRTVRRQIRGREPIKPQHRAVIRAVADQDVRTAVAAIPIYIGTALIAVGLIAMLDQPALRALLAGMLVLLAATAAWHYRSTVRAARRYLSST